jgi:hypothetical protein
MGARETRDRHPRKSGTRALAATLLTHAAVHTFAQEIRVATVPCVLLDAVHLDVADREVVGADASAGGRAR